MQASTSTKDPAFEGLLKRIRTDFKYEIKPQLRLREYFQPARRRRARKNPIPIPDGSPLASALLRKIRNLRLESSLKGIDEFPDDKNVVGGIIIVQRKDTGEILISLDKDKQRSWSRESQTIKGLRRWCFPGGRKEAWETLPRAVQRELKEETNLDARRLWFHSVGLVSLVIDPELKSFVVFTEISGYAAKYVRPGREQEKLKWAKRSIIRTLIESGAFLPNHVNYEAAFTEWEKRRGESQTHEHGAGVE